MRADVQRSLQLVCEMSCRIGEEQEAGNPVNYSLHVRRGDGGLLLCRRPGESSLRRRLQLKVQKLPITNLHSAQTRGNHSPLPSALQRARRPVRRRLPGLLCSSL